MREDTHSVPLETGVIPPLLTMSLEDALNLSPVFDRYFPLGMLYRSDGGVTPDGIGPETCCLWYQRSLGRLTSRQ